MPNSPRRVRAVLLDVDGTLVDSNDAHAHAWVEALEEFGITAPFASIRPLIGMGGDKLVPRVTGYRHDSPDGKRLTKRRGEIFREQHLPTVRAFPHVRELLQRMSDDGLTLVIATSGKDKELQPLLEIANIADLVDHKTSASDARHSKPDPDIIAAARVRAKTPAKQCVMLGDTPYDIEASARDGIACIAVRCGGWSDGDLTGAIARYDDPAAVLAAYDSSPFMGTRRGRSRG